MLSLVLYPFSIYSPTVKSEQIGQNPHVAEYSTISRILNYEQYIGVLSIYLSISGYLEYRYPEILVALVPAVRVKVMKCVIRRCVSM